MVKRVVWRRTALRRYEEIIRYLRIEWTERTAEAFVAIVNERVKLLQRFPNLGRRSEKRPELRKIILTPHNMMVYQFKNDTIFLHNIYDTRQDPLNIDA